MKVIVAGISKTGTKSMACALKELGYEVYDYLENYLYNGDKWMKICYEGGTVEDFRQMYEDVDAGVDIPIWVFWEELSQAFPDAKIILTMRDNEDEWYRSLVNQHKTFQTPITAIGHYLSPTWYKFHNYGVVLGITGYGIQSKSWFKIDDLNELLMKMVYRRHNRYVIETAPKERLLVYNVKEGWDPLCAFLEVDVPSKPFPHQNVRGSITEEMMASHPFFIRMQREMYLSCILIALGLSYGCYKIFKSPPKPAFNQVLDFGYSAVSSITSRLNFWK